MSIEATSNDSTDFEEEDRTAFEKDVEATLDELPDRFERFSSTHHSKVDGEKKLLLIPEHPWIDHNGEMQTHLLLGLEKDTIEEHNFSFSFVTTTTKGAGVKFWFTHETPEVEE